MLRLVDKLDWKRYTTRVYFVSAGDSRSLARVSTLERTIGSGSVRLVSSVKWRVMTHEGPQFRIITLPRARKVHQSYLTSVATTLWTILFCLWHVTIRPPLLSPRRKIADVIITNGPGTCVPIIFCAFLPRVSTPRLRVARS